MHFKIEIEGTDKNDSVAVEQKITLKSKPELIDKGRDIEFILALMEIPLEIKGAGLFYVKMKHEKDKSWKTLTRKSVIFNPAVSTVLQPPS